MKLLTISGRTAKEILRDPLNLFFGVGFPVILLLLLSAIQANIPVSMFEIDRLTPGITVFGLSFLTLFAATLLARDRESAFLQRLYTTPLTAADFILGYAIPLLPIALLQGAVCYLFAIPFGLTVSVRILWTLLGNLLNALFFISLGLLFGSFLGVKQVGGLCGALLTNLTAWLSGIWFDIALVGGVFEKIAGVLPFLRAVELEKALFAGSYADTVPHLIWVGGYTLLAVVLAVLLFMRQMKRQ